MARSGATEQRTSAGTALPPPVEERSSARQAADAPRRPKSEREDWRQARRAVASALSPLRPCRRDCRSRREATARDVAGLPSAALVSEAGHDEVAYAKRESSPRPASPASGEDRDSAAACPALADVGVGTATEGAFPAGWPASAGRFGCCLRTTSRSPPRLAPDAYSRVRRGFVAGGSRSTSAQRSLCTAGRERVVRSAPGRGAA